MMSPLTLRRLESNTRLIANPSRQTMIDDVMNAREAIVTKTGALAAWFPSTDTGRIPKDTYIVKHGPSVEAVDWTSPNAHPMTPEMFDCLFDQALEILSAKRKLYVLDRSVGAQEQYALPLKVMTDSPLTSLFADTMFRPCFDRAQHDSSKSVFADQPFTLLVLPHDPLRTENFEGELRIEHGAIVPRVVAMDMERRMGIVLGTKYLGAVKKTLFTAMNHLLPDHGVLPLHCSAVSDNCGETHLFLGLSGTGKTTLSTAANLSLIGDDEHLWSSDGIANIENGCYAKLIRLSTEKEPQIYEAAFGSRSNVTNGVIIENTMVYPDGSVDLDDDRLTENSRAAYPLSFLENTVPSATGSHPQTILFLTADAEGVLPPISKLTLHQALLWFLMGYTSKLAGTETGVIEPQPNFSRFFGAPFMLRRPHDYLDLFQKFVTAHGSDIYLVNTGWAGGPYGVGKRMDISLTRSLVTSALTGALESVPYREDRRFHLFVPESCPGIDPMLLNPERQWSDRDAYARRADALAAKFAATFEKNFGGTVAEEIARECPGR
ncbi:phosphoenolpyruvate carboxykinase (ATP) [Candidatus Peregrinibacteria bacterium]|nr:phosphoenolpyruvate carboxykinase (ATP) [Candidatus Peregrinibacteria bacterium]MBI3816848.1 phosphoenolpyruvate carboxykinase (ATP) [Candidatus Peregrinibacteria bacterium]